MDYKIGFVFNSLKKRMFQHTFDLPERILPMNTETCSVCIDYLFRN